MERGVSRVKNFKKLQKLVANIGLGTAIAVSAGVGLAAMPTATFAATAPTTAADNVITTAKQFMGTPYQYGAKAGNTSSFDCSSFTQYVFAQNGISIPRDSRQQSQAGTYVSRDQLQPGDLVFFYSPIHHVAIYMGNGQIIHTWGKGGVRIDSLNSGWWSSHYTTARRVISGGGQAVASAPVAGPATYQAAKKNPAVQTTPTQSKAGSRHHARHHHHHHHHHHNVD
jgi:murein DD-endopeptidase / murein LD-carboxypeptidase